MSPHDVREKGVNSLRLLSAFRPCFRLATRNRIDEQQIRAEDEVKTDQLDPHSSASPSNRGRTIRTFFSPCFIPFFLLPSPFPSRVPFPRYTRLPRAAASSMDGCYLFFVTRNCEPGISRGLGKLRSPSTTDRKQDARFKERIHFSRARSAMTTRLPAARKGS